MNLQLYNSRTRKLEPFEPLDPNRVTLYLCGPTVYNYVHIGNARGPVVFGLLVRLLKRRFGADRVVYARNITDVDDKINAAAAEAAVPIGTITQRYTAAYDVDMARLGVDPPDVVPYATQHIPQIISMCERLIASGNAYVAEHHVLFDVASFKEYGQLSGRSTDDMIDGARVEVAPYKKHPADFVLWKPSTLDLPGWESPWGRGRPGWHIECSAMIEAHLGDTIDIHAGGNDLLFPHHENEVAQSTCAHGGKIFARYWLHNGMLGVEGRKMSKSLGNTMLLHELLDKHPPEVLRYMLMKAHYRQPLDWSQAALDQAKNTLDGYYGVLRDMADIRMEAREIESPVELDEVLADDLNTPEAFVLLGRLASAARRQVTRAHKKAAKTALLGAGRFLGLLREDPEEWFTRTGYGNLQMRLPGVASGDRAFDFEQRVEKLIAERNTARTARDFARADTIRNELSALGVVIEDGAQGSRWKLAKPDECST